MNNMNELITKILKKYDFTKSEINEEDLRQAIIEICEEQKNECSNELRLQSSKNIIINSKNIAE